MTEPIDKKPPSPWDPNLARFVTPQGEIPVYPQNVGHARPVLSKTYNKDLTFVNSMQERVKADWGGKLGQMIFFLPELLLRLPFVSQVTLMVGEVPATVVDRTSNPKSMTVNVYRDQVQLKGDYGFPRGRTKADVISLEGKELGDVQKYLEKLEDTTQYLVEMRQYNGLAAEVLQDIRQQLLKQKIKLLQEKAGKDKFVYQEVRFNPPPAQVPTTGVLAGIADLEVRLTFIEGEAFAIEARENQGAWMGYEGTLKKQKNLGAVDPPDRDAINGLLVRFETILEAYGQNNSKSTKEAIMTIRKRIQGEGPSDKDKKSGLQKKMANDYLKEVLAEDPQKLSLPNLQEVLKRLQIQLRSSAQPHVKVDGQSNGFLRNAKFHVEMQGDVLVLHNQSGIPFLADFDEMFNLGASEIVSEKSVRRLETLIKKLSKNVQDLQESQGRDAAKQKSTDPQLVVKLIRILEEVIKRYRSGVRLTLERVPFSGAAKNPVIESMVSAQRQGGVRNGFEFSGPQLDQVERAFGGGKSRVFGAQALLNDPEVSAFFINADRVNPATGRRDGILTLPEMLHADRDGDGKVTLMELNEMGLTQLFRLRHDPQKQEVFRAVCELIGLSEEGREALNFFEFIDRNNNDATGEEASRVTDWRQLQIKVTGWQANFWNDYDDWKKKGIPHFEAIMEAFLSPEMKAQRDRGRKVNSALAVEQDKPQPITAWQLYAPGEDTRQNLSRLYLNLQAKPDALARIFQTRYEDLVRPLQTAPGASPPEKAKTYNLSELAGGSNKSFGSISVFNDREYRVNRVNLIPGIGHLFFWAGDLNRNHEAVLDLNHPFPASPQDYVLRDKAKELIEHWKKAKLNNQYYREAPYSAPNTVLEQRIAHTEQRVAEFMNRPPDFTENSADGRFILAGNGYTLWLKVDNEGQVEAARGYAKSSPTKDDNPEFSVYLRGRYSLTPEVYKQIYKCLTPIKGGISAYDSRKQELLAKLEQFLQLSDSWQVSQSWAEGADRPRLVHSRTARKADEAIRLEVSDEIVDGAVVTELRIIRWSDEKTENQGKNFSDILYRFGQDTVLTEEGARHLNELLDRWKALRGEGFGKDPSDQGVWQMLKDKTKHFSSAKTAASLRPSGFITYDLETRLHKLDASAQAMANAGLKEFAAGIYLNAARIIVAYGTQNDASSESQRKLFRRGAEAAENANRIYGDLLKADPELGQKNPALFENVLKSLFLEAIMWALEGSLGKAQEAWSKLASIDVDTRRVRAGAAQINQGELQNLLNRFRNHAEPIIKDYQDKQAKKKKKKKKDEGKQPDTYIPNPLADPQTRRELMSRFLEGLTTDLDPRLTGELLEVIAHKFTMDSKDPYLLEPPKNKPKPLAPPAEYFGLSVYHDMLELNARFTPGMDRAALKGFDEALGLLFLQGVSELVEEARNPAEAGAKAARASERLMRAGSIDGHRMADKAIAILAPGVYPGLLPAAALPSDPPNPCLPWDHQVQVNSLLQDLQALVLTQHLQNQPERYITESVRFGLLKALEAQKELGVAALDRGNFDYVPADPAAGRGAQWQHRNDEDPFGRGPISFAEVWNYIAHNPNAQTETMLRLAGVTPAFYAESRIMGEDFPVVSALLAAQFPVDEEKQMTPELLAQREQLKAAKVFELLVGSMDQVWDPIKKEAHPQVDRAYLIRLFRCYQVLLALCREGKLKTVAPQLVLVFEAGKEPELKLITSRAPFPPQTQVRPLSPREAMSQFYTMIGENLLSGKETDPEAGADPHVQARKHFNIALEADPQNLRALRALIRAYLEDGLVASRKKALEVLEQNLSRIAATQNKDPYMLAQIYLLQALTHRDNGAKAAALKSVQAALVTRPQDEEARLLLQTLQSEANEPPTRRNTRSTSSLLKNRTPAVINHAVQDTLINLAKRSYLQALPLLNASQHGLANYTVAEHVWQDGRAHLAAFLKNYRERYSGSQANGHFSQDLSLTPAALHSLSTGEKIASFAYFKQIGWGPQFCVRSLNPQNKKSPAAGSEAGRLEGTKDHFLSIKLSPPGMNPADEVFLEDLFEEEGVNLNAKHASFLPPKLLAQDAGAAAAVYFGLSDLLLPLSSSDDLVQFLFSLRHGFGLFSEERELQALVDELKGDPNQPRPVAEQTELLKLRLRQKLSSLGFTLESSPDPFEIKLGENEGKTVSQWQPYSIEGFLKVAENAFAKGEWQSAQSAFGEAYNKLGKEGKLSYLGAQIAAKIADCLLQAEPPPSDADNVRRQRKVLDYYARALEALMPAATNSGTQRSAEIRRLAGQTLYALGHFLNGYLAGIYRFDDPQTLELVTKIEELLTQKNLPDFIRELPSFRERMSSPDRNPQVALSALAQQCYEMALYINPDDHQALLGLAHTHRHLGSPAAEYSFARLLREEGALPASANANFFLQQGDLELKLGQRHNAARALFTALRKGPSEGEGAEILRRIFVLYREWGGEEPRYYDSCFVELNRIRREQPRTFTPAMVSAMDFHEHWFQALSGRKSREQINAGLANYVAKTLGQIEASAHPQLRPVLAQINQRLATLSRAQLMAEPAFYDEIIPALAMLNLQGEARFFVNNLQKALYETGLFNLRYGTHPVDRNCLLQASHLFTAALQLLSTEATNALLSKPVEVDGRLATLGPSRIPEQISMKLPPPTELRNTPEGLRVYRDAMEKFFDAGLGLAQAQEHLGQLHDALFTYESLFRLPEWQRDRNADLIPVLSQTVDPAKAQMPALRAYVSLALKMAQSGEIKQPRLLNPTRNEATPDPDQHGVLDYLEEKITQLSWAVDSETGRGTVSADYIALLYTTLGKVRRQAQQPGVEAADETARLLSPNAVHVLVRKFFKAYADLTLHNYLHNTKFKPDGGISGKENARLLAVATQYRDEVLKNLQALNTTISQSPAQSEPAAKIFAQAQQRIYQSIFTGLLMVKMSKIESGNTVFSVNASSKEAVEIVKALQGFKDTLKRFDIDVDDDTFKEQEKELVSPSLFSDDRKNLSEMRRGDKHFKQKVMILALWSFDRLLEAMADGKKDRATAYRTRLTQYIRILSQEGDELTVGTLLHLVQALDDEIRSKELQERLHDIGIEMAKIIQSTPKEKAN